MPKLSILHTFFSHSSLRIVFGINVSSVSEFRNVMTTDAIRYNNLSSAYIRLADAFHDAKLEEWKDLKTSWISRTVYYTRKLYDTPFVDVANVTENQVRIWEFFLITFRLPCIQMISS